MVRDIELKDQTPEETLQELFDYDNGYSERKGEAAVFLSFRGTDNQRYGSSKYITREYFNSHETRVWRDHTGAIHVDVLDVIYDPKTRQHKNVAPDMRFGWPK